MPGRCLDLLQTVFYPLHVMDIGIGQRGHAYNRVHRRTNVVAHGRQELALCPAGFLRHVQGILKFMLGLPLGCQHIRHICPHQADRAMVLVSPQYVNLLIEDLILFLIGKDKLISFRLFFQTADHVFQFKLLPCFLLILYPIELGKAIYRFAILL